MQLSDHVAVGLGVTGLIYGHLLRDWIFCRKLRVAANHFNIIPRMRDASQKSIFQAYQIFWSVWFLFWVVVVFWPSMWWKLYEPYSWVRGCMYALAFISFFLMNIARSSLESFDSWRVGAIKDERTELVTDGIYTLCRHPFIVFSLLQAVALFVLAPYVVALPLLGGLLYLAHEVAVHEERVLAHQHGALYAQYAAHTGRFWPSFSSASAHQHKKKQH